LSAPEMERLKEAAGNYAGTAIQWMSGLLSGLWEGGLAVFNVLSLLIITPVVAFYLLRVCVRDDVFLTVPSRHEGLGSIVMESFAHRCPIIATRSQGPGEVIEHDYSGLLTDIDDVGQLSDAMNLALTDAALRERLVENATQVYATTYSRQVIVDAYLDFYRRIAEQR
ncbi:glycosyltransferase, partial [Spongiibacter marinus]|uniref:glycosyltransferase n=1 Tax=Spongiibacter marinus TaxID=354246 RepID=UPI0035BE9747